MGIFDTSLSLQQIENELARQLKDINNNIRILADLEISYEDYYCLLLKVKGLEKYHNDIDFIERFQLSILTLWIFSLRLERNKYNYYKKFKAEFVQMEQHYIRKFIQIMLNTFDEYQLNTYGLIREDAFQDLFALLVVHTGIPNELQDDFCHLLDDSLVYGEQSGITNRFLMRLPEHMKRLYSFVDKKVIIDMINYSSKMFADYRLYRITKREAYLKYPLMSSNLMKGCFHWCETQETNMRSFG